MTTYTLTHPRLSGSLTVSYTAGVLQSLRIDVQGLNADRWAGVRLYIPWDEADLAGSIWTVAQQPEPLPTNQKIALFCAEYQRHMGTPYKVTRPEAGKVKSVEMTPELLEAWFTSTEWWAKTKTLGRYVRFISELRESVRATPSRWPSHYDRDLEAKMKPAELQEYWAHLRALGLRPVKRAGKTIDWK